jgi:hypothetical protein
MDELFIVFLKLAHSVRIASCTADEKWFLDKKVHVLSALRETSSGRGSVPLGEAGYPFDSRLTELNG